MFVSVCERFIMPPPPRPTGERTPLYLAPHKGLRGVGDQQAQIIKSTIMQSSGKHSECLWQHLHSAAASCTEPNQFTIDSPCLESAQGRRIDYAPPARRRSASSSSCSILLLVGAEGFVALRSSERFAFLLLCRLGSSSDASSSDDSLPTSKSGVS